MIRWRWWKSASDLTTTESAEAATGDWVTAAQFEQLSIRVRHVEELRVRIARLEARLEKQSAELTEILERIGRLGGTRGGPE